jgi:hypothetical protein
MKEAAPDVLYRLTRRYLPCGVSASARWPTRESDIHVIEGAMSGVRKVYPELM